jgi:hypothetical protein
MTTVGNEVILDALLLRYAIRRRRRRGRGRIVVAAVTWYDPPRKVLACGHLLSQRNPESNARTALAPAGEPARNRGGDDHVIQTKVGVAAAWELGCGWRRKGKWGALERSGVCAYGARWSPHMHESARTIIGEIWCACTCSLHVPDRHFLRQHCWTPQAHTFQPPPSVPRLLMQGRCQQPARPRLGGGRLAQRRLQERATGCRGAGSKS